MWSSAERTAIQAIVSGICTSTRIVTMLKDNNGVKKLEKCLNFLSLKWICLLHLGTFIYDKFIFILQLYEVWFASTLTCSLGTIYDWKAWVHIWIGAKWVEYILSVVAKSEQLLDVFLYSLQIMSCLSKVLILYLFYIYLLVNQNFTT